MIKIESLQIVSKVTPILMWEFVLGYIKNVVSTFRGPQCGSLHWDATKDVMSIFGARGLIMIFYNE